MSMVNILMDARPLIKKILLAFEQSSTKIKYDQIYKYDDGPNDIKQITLSFGITEYGNLRNFIKDYIFSGGEHAKFFTDYVDKIGTTVDTFTNKTVNDLTKIYFTDLEKSFNKDSNVGKTLKRFTFSENMFLSESPKSFSEAMKRRGEQFFSI
jgi:hypothetical protein